MDLIDKFINGIVATISLIAIFFFLQHYRFFKSLISTARTVFKENVTGKVILITGASFGIGEHLAYEYARRGAHVSKIEDCKRFVDATVNHFGHLDHLVTNAGVTPVCLFEDYDDITKGSPAMDINFWGSVYSTYFAHRHLKKSKGNIIVMASSTAWLFAPRMGFYNASKAALVSFYETLRTEFGIQIGITIVSPGLIKTEMTEGKFLSKEGRLEVDREMRDVSFSLKCNIPEREWDVFSSFSDHLVIDCCQFQVSLMPLESAEKCAKAIVDSARHGEKYLTVPSWAQATLLWKVFCLR
ncbi:hypothetical protein CRYUN_Cryun12cG0177300 [Craigia yunnanensis]